MKNEFISSDGKSVDYIGWKRSDLFTEYTDLIQELCSLDMTTLTEEGKTAFFISILRQCSVKVESEPQSTVWSKHILKSRSYCNTSTVSSIYVGKFII